MVKVVVVANRKGGSGKSTVAVNLAAILARKAQTILVDLDPQGSAAAQLETTDALPVVHLADPAALAAVISRTKAGRGVVVVDLPPLDETITANAIRLADLVIVPVRPTPPDLRAVAPLLRVLLEGGRPTLAVLNQTRPGSRSVRLAREALASMGVRVARAEIGFRVVYADAAADRVAIVDHAPRSRAAEEMLKIAREVRALLEV